MPRMRAAPTATRVAVTGSGGVGLVCATAVVDGVVVGAALAADGDGVVCGVPVEGTLLEVSLGEGACVGCGVAVGVGVGVGVGLGAT